MFLYSWNTPFKNPFQQRKGVGNTLLVGSIVSGRVTTRQWPGSAISVRSQVLDLSATSSKLLCFSMLLAIESTPFYNEQHKESVAYIIIKQTGTGTENYE